MVWCIFKGKTLVSGEILYKTVFLDFSDFLLVFPNGFWPSLFIGIVEVNKQLTEYFLYIYQILFKKNYFFLQFLPKYENIRKIQ